MCESKPGYVEPKRPDWEYAGINLNPQHFETYMPEKKEEPKQVQPIPALQNLPAKSKEERIRERERLSPAARVEEEPKQVQAPEREEMLDEGQWEVLCDMALELGLPPIVYQIVRQAELARAEVGRLALKLDCANAQADLFAERLRSLRYVKAGGQ